MGKFRPWRPSAGLVVSIIALIVALGGTSYAAFSLPKNTVGTKQLRTGAVTTKKIKNGAVTGSKIKLSTLGTVPSAARATSSAQLGSGQSETGVWSANDTNQPAYGAISFVHALASKPTIHLIAPGATPPSGCSGSVAAPAASPGNLCVFADFLFNSTYGGSFDPGGTGPGAGVHGAVVFLSQVATSHFDGAGTWAVTAP
jgi:hypothetical protein